MSSWCFLIEVKQARFNASLYGIPGKKYTAELFSEHFLTPTVNTEVVTKDF